MKCTEFRDLAELLRDGALEASEAKAARAHFAGCPACRSFEDDCAVLLAPLRGLPPGPYLPPSPARHLPPWATGSVLGILLSILLVGGGAAWALRGAGRPPVVETGRATPRPPPAPAPRPVPVQAEPPAPSIDAAGGGATLLGRVVTFPGGKPVAGAAIRIDGVPAATTDGAGVFRVGNLAPGGSRLLRLAPAGGAPFEALLPDLEPGQVHSLADLLVGRPGSATVRVVRWDALPAAGVRVRACRLAPTTYPDSDSGWMPGMQGVAIPAHASDLTDAEGVAEFPSLAPGTWTFQAEREGIPFSAPADLEVRDDPDLAATLYLDPAGAFEGRVLDDATGTPVEGAQVRWSRIGLRAGSADVRHHGAAGTDAEGRFRFDGAPAIPLFLEVWRPGAPCRSGALSVDASRVDRVDIRLPRIGVLAGVCIEAGTGLPAAGAVVRLSSQLTGGLDFGEEHFFTRSGPDGRFEVRGIPETALLQADIQPRTAWCSPGPREVNLLLVGTPCRIEAARAGSAGGVVRNAAGLPAAGRPVVALEILRLGTGLGDLVVRVAQAVSDPEGRFLLENLPPGRAVILSPEPEDLGSPLLEAEARELLASSDSTPSIFTVPLAAGATLAIPIRGPDPATEVSVPGTRQWSIRGKVVDLAGAPAHGTFLMALKGDLAPAFQDRGSSPLLWLPPGIPVPVAEDGSFHAEIPLDGKQGDSGAEACTLLACSPLHPPAFAVARFGDGDVAEGVVLQFETGVVLAGRVLHEDGTPASGALLEAVPQQDARPNDNNFMVRARAGEDGSFRIEGLHRGPHTLAVGRGPGPVHSVAGLVPGGDPVEVHLPPGDGVRPKLPVIHGPSREPSETERTASLRGRILGARWRSVCVFEPTSPGNRTLDSVVDEAGHFECRVPPGRRFSLAADLGEGRWIFADDIPADSGDIVLRVEAPFTGLLRGRVVTPAGSAAARVPVHAVRLRGKGEPGVPAEARLDGREWSGAGDPGPLVPRFVRTTLTGSDGSFDLGSPPGNWAVFAGLPGSDDLAPGTPVPWSSTDPRFLEISLSPGRVLLVKGVDDDAPPEPLPPAWAEVRMDGFLPGADGPVLALRFPPRPDGLFEFRGLPAGRVTVLLLDGNRKETGRGSTEPGDPRDAPAEIRLRR